MTTRTQRSRPQAYYLGGLSWQCPTCYIQNSHSFPYVEGRSPTLDDMFGQSRACSRCPCNYVLSNVSMPNFSDDDDDDDTFQDS